MAFKLTSGEVVIMAKGGAARVNLAIDRCAISYQISRWSK